MGRKIISALVAIAIFAGVASVMLFPSASPLSYPRQQKVTVSFATTLSGGGMQTLPSFSALFTDVSNALREAILSSLPTASASSSGEIVPLPLPTVPTSELAIDPTGASTTSAYIDYFVHHAQSVALSSQDFALVLKTKDNVILLPAELVERALGSGNFHEIHGSLLVAQKFLNVKLAFEKAIKVTGGAIALNQEMIGFDELTQTLIQNALNAEAGAMSLSDMQTFLNRYFETAREGHATIASKVSLVDGKKSAWAMLFDHFSMVSVTHAAMPPFGGQITSIKWCPCDTGWVVEVGPPVSARLFVPVAFLSSPLFYEFHQMSIGVWWLGLYTTTYVPCLVPDVDGCTDIGGANLIYMTGTSGGGGGIVGGGGGGGTSGGSCQPLGSGPCSVNSLLSTPGTCFTGDPKNPADLQRAQKGSSICDAESGGDPFIGSGVDKTIDGQPVSWGAFQVNKTVHTVPPGAVGGSGTTYSGGLNCPSAFSGPYTGASSRVSIVDQNLYNQCVDANQNSNTNIQEACAISNNGTNWNQWGSASKCGLKA